MPSATRPQRPLRWFGRGLADLLDRQPLDLEPRAVAADPREPGVDDVADPGHRERRLGDVGGEHDAAGAARPEDPLLLTRREARVERQELDVLRQAAGQRLRGVADLALAREEDEDVAGRLAQQFLDGVADRVGLVAVEILGVLDRAVADLDRIRAAGDLDDRDVVAEVPREAVRVDRRRRDDQLQVGPLREDPREVAEQEVDVEAALVRLVDDHRVVAAQQAVALDLGDEEAVGQQPQAGLRPRAVGEAHRRSRRRRRARSPARSRSARPPCARRAAAAACGRSSPPGRGRAPGRASGAASSSPTRSRPPRRRPGGRGSPRAARRGGPRRAAPAGRRSAALPRGGARRDRGGTACAPSDPSPHPGDRSWAPRRGRPRAGR